MLKSYNNFQLEFNHFKNKALKVKIMIRNSGKIKLARTFKTGNLKNPI